MFNSARLIKTGIAKFKTGRSQASFQAQAAHFRFCPDSGHIAASHRSATKSADRDDKRD